MRILIASTFTALIKLLQIMIRSSKMSQKSPFPSKSSHLLDPLLVARFARSPQICGMCSTRIFYVYGDDTSQRACIHLGHQAIILRLAIIGKVTRRLMHSSKSMLNGLHMQWSVRLSWRRARTSLVSTLFAIRVIHQLSYL